MKRLILATAALALLSTSAFADVKPFTITGTVVALTPTSITLQDTRRRFEFARDANTPAPAGLKVGDKVFIQTKFVAMSIGPMPTKAAVPAPVKPR